MINNVSLSFQFVSAVLIPMCKNGAVDEVHLKVLFSNGRGIYSLFVFRVLEPQKHIVNVFFGLAIMIISVSYIMLLDNVISISYMGN